MYPIPLPASEVTTTEGAKRIKNGKSCAASRSLISCSEILVCANGDLSSELTAFTAAGLRTLIESI